MPPPGLKIAFTFDRKSDWLALGLTEDECLEFQSDCTIDSIAASLRKCGAVEMVGSMKRMVARLAAGPADWDVVFNYAEGYGHVGREAQVPSLLDAWGVHYTLSDPAALALCQDKAKAKAGRVSV